MIPLDIQLNGDGAWPDLANKKVLNGALTGWAVLDQGTTRGRPAIMLRGELPNGDVVVLETTWNLVYSAARATEARYGGAQG